MERARSGHGGVARRLTLSTGPVHSAVSRKGPLAQLASALV